MRMNGAFVLLRPGLMMINPLISAHLRDKVPRDAVLKIGRVLLFQQKGLSALCWRM